MDEMRQGLKLEGYIPLGRDAWGRQVPQYLPYDFSGNGDSVSAIQYCNGWNDAGGYWLNYTSDIQSKCDELLHALKDMVLIHDEPSGFSGKYGRALDDVIEAQKEKIDGRLSKARAAISNVTGVSYK